MRQEPEQPQRPQPLSPPQEARLKAILAGELSLDDERLEEVANDAREIQATIEALSQKRTQGQALVASVGIEIIRKEGAFDKCVYDLKRWDPVLSGKANGADDNPPEPPAPPAPGAN